MAGILVNGCKTQLLNIRLAAAPFGTLEMGLFTGAYVPSQATVFADLTEQVGTGYSRQAVVNWTSALLLIDGKAFSQSDPVTFTNSGGTPWLATTGWFWYDTALNRLVAVSRYLVGFVLPAGLSFTTSPFYTDTGESV